MTKVLVLGKRGGILQWYEHLLATATELEDVSVVGCALNHNNGFERACKKIVGAFSKKRREQMTLNAIKKAVESLQPDVIFVADLFYFTAPILNYFASLKPRIKLAQWIGDFFDERILAATNIFDLFCLTDSGFIEKAHELGFSNTLYLPLAVNPQLFQSSTDWEARDNKLLFIGAWSANRADMLAQVRSPMMIIGKGWDQLTGTPHQIIGKNISIQEVARLYQQHKYVLNIINSGNIKHALNMRCFEAPAAGALLITDNVRDLPANYGVNEEVLTYDTPQQLDERYKQLLAGEISGEVIASKGMQNAKTSHTYAQRLKALLDIIT